MIKLNIDELLSFEKKKLFERITRYVGKKFDQDNDLLGIEIHKYLGIHNSRISEWKDFDKYQLPISKRNLALCLGGGIVTINELIKNCTKNEKEKEYLKTLSLFENEPLQNIIRDAEALGLDPIKLIQEGIKNYSKK